MYFEFKTEAFLKPQNQCQNTEKTVAFPRALKTNQASRSPKLGMQRHGKLVVFRERVAHVTT